MWGWGPWKMNVCERQWGAAACRVCAWVSGSGAEICFYLCSGSGRVVKGEMAEQLGARASTVTEQSAD